MKTTMAGVTTGACRFLVHGAWARFKRPVLAITVLCAAAAAGAAEPPHLIALFPSASSPHWEGFARIINHSDEPGTVRITGIDDAGVEHGPVELSLEARASVHLNSADLEAGSAQKGLPRGLDDGDGDWRLHLSSELDIEPLSYIRTGDGFVTAMHQVVPAEGMRHHVRFFNPGSNESQVSWLRLVNPAEEAVEVTIEGRDDAGEAAPGGAVSLTLAPGEARTLTAQALESGGAGMTGSLGDGKGKWQLFVSAGGALEVMSLLASPTGHLSNLSAFELRPPVCDPATGERTQVFALFPSASSPHREGFARVINHSDEPGTVRITGIDDAGVEHGPVELSLEARASVHFNSADLEAGSAQKGLSAGLDHGEGDWRLHLSSELDIEPLSYIRTGDGFVTAMHQAVPAEGMRHHVRFFNPGSNSSQVSRLRLVNPTEEAVEVTIEGRDDAGEAAPGGAVGLTLAPGEARTLTAQALESGGAGMTGSLGDGTGKWQLFVSAGGGLEVMSLLVSPTGHLSNLSAPVIAANAANAATPGTSTTVPEPRPGQLTTWRDNTPAENILDHWNDADALRRAMGLCDTDVGSGQAAFARLSETLEVGAAESATLLRNVGPDAMEIVGERAGITRGRWKGGPAGTLDIDVDFRFVPDLSESVRAQFERAAKVWARRIRDDFRTYTIPKGRTFSFSEGSIGGSDRGTVTFTFDEDATTNGLLIPVVATDKTPWAALGFDVDNFESDVENTEEDFQPSLAVMFVNPDNPDLRGRWADTAAHEIGHALGITAVRDGQRTVKNLSWLRNLDLTDHTFDGPRARGANGGRPVPLQWLVPGRIAVPPRTAGAERDPGHLGVCNSIVSYVCNLPEVLIPTELDFAVLDDIGYEILDPETASEPELYGYAAWGRYSAGGAGVERKLHYARRSRPTRGRFGASYRGYEFRVDELRAGVDAFGIAPDANFGEADPPAGLPAIAWSGTLIGVDMGHEGLPPVVGNARIRVERSTLRGTVQVHDLRVVADGKFSPFRTRDLRYDISLAGNDFADAGGRLAGSLFGPGHEEMAATVHDARSGVQLLAVVVTGRRAFSP